MSRIKASPPRHRFLRSAHQVDFGASNTIFTTAEIAGKPKHWTFLASSAAIVLCYNVPGITDQLLVDRATVVQIYLRNVRFWNDTRLQALNPGVKLPGELINLVYRSDASGTTNTFLQALRSFDPVQWKYPVVDKMTWPIQTIDPTHAFPAAGNYQGSFQVALNPYSIGYISLPFANNLPCFAMINQAGNNVTATASAVQVNTLPRVFAASIPQLTVLLGQLIMNSSFRPLSGTVYWLVRRI
jgi:phosphate transport system substrate-binding protein